MLCHQVTINAILNHQHSHTVQRIWCCLWPTYSLCSTVYLVLLTLFKSHILQLHVSTENLLTAQEQWITCSPSNSEPNVMKWIENSLIKHVLWAGMITRNIKIKFHLCSTEIIQSYSKSEGHVVHRSLYFPSQRYVPAPDQVFGLITQILNEPFNFIAVQKSRPSTYAGILIRDYGCEMERLRPY